MSPQTVVTDLCGEVNELGQGNIETEPRPFNDCGKIEYPYWFSFDPQHHHILYCLKRVLIRKRIDLYEFWT